MRVVAAFALGLGVLLTGVGPRPRGLADRVGDSLRMPKPPAPRVRPDPRPLLRAGVDWSRREALTRRAASAGVGAFLGVLAAQGDFFVVGASRSLPGMALANAPTSAPAAAAVRPRSTATLIGSDQNAASPKRGHAPVIQPVATTAATDSATTADAATRSRAIGSTAERPPTSR